MPSPHFLKILLLFVKLASNILRVRTVDLNENEDNHEKDVVRNIQGKIRIKLLMIK